MRASSVQTGLDRFLGPAGRRWRSKRLGLIAHAASVTSSLEHAVNALKKKGFRLAALFAPEHGLAASLQDQAAVGTSRDPGTGLPVHSLYGKTLAPTEAMLKDLDALVFDLQDVGVRYYTFIWTMLLALRACAKAGRPFIVLDRPNPLGGEKIEGNMPDPAFASFVGLSPLPVLHGMTVGELARYFNEVENLRADLQVVPLTGWRRAMRFDETGLPWVLPSPNMPTLETATVYGGMCLLEGTNLSEGRGTTRPFETVGAPFVDGRRLAAALQMKNIPGVRFRPLGFQPTFGKWEGRPCGGVQLHVADPRRFPSFLTGLHLLQTVRRLWPREFRWKNPPYEYETRRKPMDILCGAESLRHSIERGADLNRIARAWRSPLSLFQRRRRPFLLYPN